MSAEAGTLSPGHRADRVRGGLRRHQAGPWRRTLSATVWQIGRLLM